MWTSGFDKKTDDIIEKYAKRFSGFRKKRWYIDWLLELENFVKELKKVADTKD